MGLLESLLQAVVNCLCPSQADKPSEQELSQQPQHQQQQPTYAHPIAQQPAQQAPPHAAYPVQQPVHEQVPPSSQPPHGGLHEGMHEHERPHGKPHEGHHSQSPPRKHSPGPRVDPNQVNQHNPHYTSLRSRANEEGDKMASCFDRSHQAYENGDGALAKELSNEGKVHQREMERLNQEASEWIFVENNKDSKPGEIDLHGLYVKEAIAYTDRAIQEARSRGDSEVHFIVGKGLHSKGGVAKLKPAIEELMQKHQLIAELDPQNSGVLIVSLDGQDKGTGRALQPEDITRGIESKDEGCVIM